jgi:hypothetical protein
LFQAESLRAGLRPILPQWKIPARVHAIETLPLTPTGKIDRPLLQQYLQARRLAETGDDAPDRNADGLTARLIKIWQGLFGRARNW